MSGLHLRWIICTLCLRLWLLIGDMTSVLCLPKSYYDHFGPLALCPVIKADFLLRIKTNSERFFKSTWLRGGVGGGGTDARSIIKKSVGAERFSLRFFGAAQSIDPSGATLSLSNLGKKKQPWGSASLWFMRGEFAALPGNRRPFVSRRVPSVGWMGRLNHGGTASPPCQRI